MTLHATLLRPREPGIRKHLRCIIMAVKCIQLEKSPHQIIGENRVKREAARDCIERSVTKPYRAKVGQNSGIGIVTVSAAFL